MMSAARVASLTILDAAWGSVISPLLANIYLLRVAVHNRYNAECIVTRSLPLTGAASESF